MEKSEDKILKLGVLFYITSIFGYIYELILTFVRTTKVFSHGFLSGPWLPIYGIGSLIIMSLYKLRNNPLKIFIAAFILSGVTEYFGGLILLKVFKKRLWDYTGWFLNIDGLICFASLLCFAFGGLLIIYMIYPLVNRIYEKINKNTLKNIFKFLSLIFFCDLIASLLK